MTFVTRFFFASLIAWVCLLSGYAKEEKPKPKVDAPSDHDELQPEDPNSKPVSVQVNGKTIRILKIGNSFSQNATEYLPQIAASQGNNIIFGRAEIGGCPLKKHWDLSQAYEAHPEDPANKAYSGNLVDGKPVKMSLKEILVSQPWDVVTMQQHSLAAPDIETYRPYAKQLAEYVRKYAPTAKIWFHETWAYRADDKIFKKGDFTQAKMYENIHESYATIGKEIQVDKIIPCATAFQNARKDPRWQLEVEKFDVSTLKFPDLPKQIHALCTGYKWDTKVDPAKLAFDGKHCTVAGKYLGGLVWYETFFGALTKPAFVPDKLPAEDATFLQEIAKKTVIDGVKP
jgi:hypothetical protein